ncbi:MAG: 16S rRNA (cytidine(1402)-2'-O)-methyltransferase [Synechococcaceae bacterium LLD_019]|nr:16S rRNA (cytidine(1402)-2'-O)-methyltransferase [Synechococcaceae bacterium WB6_1B_055]NBQ19063.1 16S rRNA (cytidine(1402)-2'-O)-methyltransferase [Synechococcaceae bacterium WB5_2A_257]NBR43548.1 16S rRNA (cytidine(1402)-2'-O)-methyltransferase [Synechococcaceae bacterium WB5_2B_268]NBY59219.1 16S rRNA (cytidine(1402)-2'-O)-methyltransferase [Synechococcaceae bacterium LLD_019]NCU76964.1 16S rRNA (cytidine(1402)-2'-O)-methyltransferase [Synechococcaceae bacterium WB7_1C_051]NCU92096.1 16S
MGVQHNGIVTESPEPQGGVLYLVGTPIGHRGDLSPRAQMVLAGVDRIACEDTRHSGQLLHFFGISKPLLSFHEHNQKQRIPALLDALGAGEALALVSDAGLPGISDPGEALVAAARAAGHRVVCIPGPCAATTALVSSGLPSGRFCFEGFLPLKGRERKSRLEAISQESRTTVLYEAPHRLVRLLQELVEHCGPERPVQVARELTKRHEEQVGPDLAGALAHFLASAPQGECTLVLGGAATEATVLAWDETQLRQELTALVASGLTASEAAKELAQSSGLQRRALYGLLNRAN